MKVIPQKSVMSTKNGMMRLFGKGLMKYDCGNVIDRDRNSAINIMKRFLSQNVLWPGYQQLAEDLLQTGLPMGIQSLEPKTQVT